MKEYTIEASVSKLKVESNGEISFKLTGAEGYCVKYKEETNEKKEDDNISYNIFIELTRSRKSTTKNAIRLLLKKEFKSAINDTKIFQVLLGLAGNKSKAKFELEFLKGNMMKINSIEMM